ncbi:hypothetical protein BDQ94DRAFT_141394 [Aspergillus welwitschiae]|uniref:Uncharacterized protein n=1 Tax=Aspergillus welwitschiae TaxID=1341132 RepID=A0A3F3Q576_9EURO|nr:hypothetical protein BDQ94DRAFT_141394 [Aspergillus welwitschiae]RDH34394.1 hypothetical protein BDQ94DRAFT_141394 [Aspergillus welwitschiae]
MSRPLSTPSLYVSLLTFQSEGRKNEYYVFFFFFFFLLMDSGSHFRPSLPSFAFSLSLSLALVKSVRARSFD